MSSLIPYHYSNFKQTDGVQAAQGLGTREDLSLWEDVHSSVQTQQHFNRRLRAFAAFNEPEASEQFSLDSEGGSICDSEPGPSFAILFLY